MQEARAGGEALSALSTTIVQLMRESTGRGPTRCKSHWAGPDTIVTLLGGGSLTAERTLYEAGHARQVQSVRAAIQDLLESRMRAAVEELFGREVVSFLSANSDDADLMVEIFVLAPADDGGDGDGG